LYLKLESSSQGESEEGENVGESVGADVGASDVHTALQVYGQKYPTLRPLALSSKLHRALVFFLATQEQVNLFRPFNLKLSLSVQSIVGLEDGVKLGLPLGADETDGDELGTLLGCSDGGKRTEVMIPVAVSNSFANSPLCTFASFRATISAGDTPVDGEALIVIMISRQRAPVIFSVVSSANIVHGIMLTSNSTSGSVTLADRATLDDESDALYTSATALAVSFACCSGLSPFSINVYICDLSSGGSVGLGEGIIDGANERLGGCDCPKNVGTELNDGLSDGDEDGAALAMVGPTLGLALGIALGLSLGLVLGISPGLALGATLGLALGTSLGLSLGLALGASLGLSLGLALGVSLGLSLGLALGASLGISLELALGVSLGLLGTELG